MTEDEITAILGKAHGCVDSECAVNDVDDLISDLKDQQKVLNARLENIMNVVAHLQNANEQKERDTNGVRAIVKDMLRVFTTSVSWMGWWEWSGLYSGWRRMFVFVYVPSLEPRLTHICFCVLNIFPFTGWQFRHGI